MIRVNEIELTEEAIDIIHDCQRKLQPIIEKLQRVNAPIEGANGLVFAIYDILGYFSQAADETELWQKIRARFNP